MKRNNKNHSAITEQLAWIGVGFAALFWFIESAIHVFVFHEGGLVQQISNPPPHEIWMRLIVVAMFILFAVYAQLIIIQRRRAEKATRHAYAELNQIFDTAADGMRVVDREFNVLRTNETFSKLSGIRKEEAVGKKCYEVFRGPVCHTSDCPLTLILGGEERVEYDAEKRRKEGVTVPCIVTATPFRGPDGDLIGIVEDFKDIRDRKAWIERLRQSEAQKKAILDASVDVIMQVSREMRIVWANKMAAEVVAKLPKDLIGQKCYELFQNLDSPCHGCPCKKALETGNVEHEIMYQADTGCVGESYWENYGVPLKNKSGRIDGVIVIARNVTEKVRAEKALFRAKEDWENTFDAITDMVMLLDNEHHIIRVNKAAAEALHTRKRNLVHTKCYEAVHGRSRPIARCPLLLTKKTLQPQTIEITEPNLGGTFICSTSPILNRAGEFTGYTHSLKDITESKRLEAQLQHAQRMEAIGTLAGGIAHDFNNVLMGIQGHTSLMLLDMGPDHADYGHVIGIEDMVHRGADLTRQLLGFARGGKYEVKATNLNELIKKSAEMFGRTKKEIKIRTKFEEEIWPVEVDRAQIEQVLMNLYVNAWQAMPDGGKLHVETDNVVLDEGYTTPFGVSPGNYVKIFVRDTGIGMDKATQQRIFDPFFTTKEMGRGTGLGLSSAYGIVKNHGGIINVYSEKAKGSGFSIYLPASRKEVPLGEEALADEILKGTETILLVDDEDMILDVGKRMLGEMGYKVLIAGSGEEGVEVYSNKKGEIDLVILDMVMPDMGGGEAYDRMKAEDPDVKVMLSSGYSVNGRAAEILERGCNGFIQKPFNIKELSAKIREMLEKQ